ncbi:MAG: diadenylate cyclase CdaA [Selenomonadales bacterium]|nr:diadenylate cyclase CdaA [Selenomonadales bacterium]
MAFQVTGLLSTITLLDIVDILIVAFILYKMYMGVKDTRALALFKGIIVLLVITLLSKVLELYVIYWLLQKLMTMMLVALPVVFQPELRRALEHLGRGRLFKKQTFLDTEETETFLTHIVNTAGALSQNKIGALMVLERETGLGDYADTGVKIDGIVSSEFLINVFIPNTPLHDGATIIRGNRVVAAGCLLPLTDDRTLNKELGTRHRAAIGMTEQTDSVVIVVSEETGIISLAREGRLTRYLDKETLKETLRPLLKESGTSLSDLLNWRQFKW